MPDLSLPEPGQVIDLLYLEIDLGTETSGQLTERATHWHTALAERYARLPPGSGPLCCGSSMVRCSAPLLITTVAQLTFGTTFHPWYAIW
jgi:hypothetical protein